MLLEGEDKPTQYKEMLYTRAALDLEKHDWTTTYSNMMSSRKKYRQNLTGSRKIPSLLEFYDNILLIW